MTITKVLDTKLAAAGSECAHATKTAFATTTKEFILSIRLAGVQLDPASISVFYTCTSGVETADAVAATYDGFERKNVRFTSKGRFQLESTKPLKVFGSHLVFFISHPTKPSTASIKINLIELT
jgi:hypothetical protein